MVMVAAAVVAVAVAVGLEVSLEGMMEVIAAFVVEVIMVVAVPRNFSSNARSRNVSRMRMAVWSNSATITLREGKKVGHDRGHHDNIKLVWVL